MPSSRQVRITRRAISPRLATSTFSNIGRLEPRGLALLQEGPDALPAFLARPYAGDEVRRVLVDLSVVGRRATDQLLADALRLRPARQEGAHHLLDGRVQLGIGHDAVDEADGQRVGRVEALAGQEEAQGPALTDLLDDVGRDRRR